MPAYTDQIGNIIHLEEVPKRIISIVPSQSEFLWDLGLSENLVGITKFCIHPNDMYTNTERVGGTKKIDIEKIRKLNPDLIIGNKEENSAEDIVLLQKEFKVWMSDISTLKDMYEMMNSLGAIFDKENEVLILAEKLQASFSRIKNKFRADRLLYFIWNDPYMVAANRTFIDHILQHLGFTNVAALLERYPELDEVTIKKLDPAICFLSSEPFPFKEKHLNNLQTLLPNAKIVLVDGEMFSWYGTRLMNLERYVEELAEKLGPKY